MNSFTPNILDICDIYVDAFSLHSDSITRSVYEMLDSYITREA